MADIKFCGLMQTEDAACAASLGAAYLGVIFAGGPRRLTAARAREVLDGGGPNARRVGVFGRQPAEEIAKVASESVLDVVQLHGDPTRREVESIRNVTDAKIWAVVRVTDSLPPFVAELLDISDALLIDARVSGSLGGSGVVVEWDAIASQLDSVRGNHFVVVAGGLSPQNVARAIEVLRPDVVDVSSGVELSPGIKDHARMRAFAAAVAGATEEK